MNERRSFKELFKLQYWQFGREYADVHPRSTIIAGELVDRAFDLVDEHYRGLMPGRDSQVSPLPYDAIEAKGIRRAAAALLRAAAAILEES